MLRKKRPTTNLPTRARRGNKLPQVQDRQQGTCGQDWRWIQQVCEGSPPLCPGSGTAPHKDIQAEHIACNESREVQDHCTQSTRQKDATLHPSKLSDLHLRLASMVDRRGCGPFSPLPAFGFSDQVDLRTWWLANL
jgi:hypothetical protein